VVENRRAENHQLPTVRRAGGWWETDEAVGMAYIGRKAVIGLRGIVAKRVNYIFVRRGNSTGFVARIFTRQPSLRAFISMLAANTCLPTAQLAPLWLAISQNQQ
jgi:hypothetical protein